MKTVQIGIVTYNSCDDIDACLQAIEAQTYPDIKVLILDNASTDGTADWIAERWPQHQLIRSDRNLGFGNAHNQIILNTESGYYMPLNPDVILTDGFVAAMVEAIEKAPDIGSVVGKLFLTDKANKDQPPLLYTVGHAIFRDGFATNIGVRRPDSELYQHPREVFGVNAAAPLYRREMLEDVQANPGEVFDRTIFLYHEDVDLDWRVRLLGWRCFFTPYAIGYHQHGASGGLKVKAISYSITANRYYSTFKHAFLLDLLTYNIPAFILHITFMLLTEPRRGWATFASVVSRTREIVAKRRWLAKKRKLSRKELLAWFEWSKRQHSNFSYNYFARFWRGRVRGLPVE